MLSLRGASKVSLFKRTSFYLPKRGISDHSHYEEYNPVKLFSSVVQTLPTSTKNPQTLILYKVREKIKSHQSSLHGLLGSNENWKLLSKLVSKDLSFPLHIHSLDLRNHGKSGHSEDHSYEHMATDLDHYITNHKLSNITLIGHSMGGKLAMYYALVRPQNVDKLVIFDGIFSVCHLLTLQRLLLPTTTIMIIDLKVISHFFFGKFLFSIVTTQDQTPPPICTLKCLTAMKQIPLETLKTLKEADDILIKHFPEKSGSFHFEILIHIPSERNFYLKQLELDPKTKKYKWALNLNGLHNAQYKILDFPLITTKPFAKPALFIGILTRKDSNFLKREFRR